MSETDERLTAIRQRSAHLRDEAAREPISTWVTMLAQVCMQNQSDIAELLAEVLENQRNERDH